MPVARAPETASGVRPSGLPPGFRPAPWWGRRFRLAC